MDAYDIFQEINKNYKPQPVKPPEKPMPSALNQWGKTLARGAVNTGQLVSDALSGAALTGGLALGVSPEDNVITKELDARSKRYEDIKRGYSEDQAEYIQAGVEQPKESSVFTKDQRYAEKHPVQNFLQEQVEGAMPWILAGGLSTVTGPATLPAVAGLASEARNTRKLMDRGTEGTEAAKQAVPAAGTESQYF